MKNNFYFTGREFDRLDSGSLWLGHYRTRYLLPSMGRFLQTDQLGINPAGGIHNPLNIIGQYRDGLNLYQYVRSNPIVNFDSFGLACSGGVCGVKPSNDCGNIYKYYEPPSIWWLPVSHSGILVNGKDYDVGLKDGTNFTAVCPYKSVASPEAKNMTKLYKRNQGKMLLGPQKGKRCCCLTCSDVKNCIKYNCSKWDGGFYYVFFHDCHTFTRSTINNCCLTSGP